MVNNGWHNKIINHDVTKPFPLDDGCIDVVVTSPPYWGLRDYGVDGQIGLESHPQEYINHLVAVAREIKRVLKKSGSFYLNLGDTYCSHSAVSKNVGGFEGKQMRKNLAYRDCRIIGKKIKYDKGWIQDKQLMLIPVRVAAALQDDGWILRNDIIWHKPNPMPSSVKDRLNNTFEHVFHFVKSRKYFYNLDSIREPHKTHENRPFGIVRNREYGYDSKLNKIRGLKSGESNIGQQQYHSANIEYNHLGKNPGDVIYKEQGSVAYYEACKKSGHYGEKRPIEAFRNLRHPMGKNPGDFWNVCTQPFTSYNAELEHFAVFPEELIVKPLKASCPKDGVVLDPFCGRGTVGKVAKDLGLNYVLFDIKPEYCELACLYVNGQKRKLIKYQNKLDFEET